MLFIGHGQTQKLQRGSNPTDFISCVIKSLQFKLAYQTFKIRRFGGIQQNGMVNGGSAFLQDAEAACSVSRR